MYTHNVLRHCMCSVFKMTFLGLQRTIFSLQCTVLYSIHCAVYRGLDQVVLVHALIPPSLSWIHCTHNTVTILQLVLYNLYCTNVTHESVQCIKNTFSTLCTFINNPQFTLHTLLSAPSATLHCAHCVLYTEYCQ